MVKVDPLRHPMKERHLSDNEQKVGPLTVEKDTYLTMNRKLVL